MEAYANVEEGMGSAGVVSVGVGLPGHPSHPEPPPGGPR